MYSSNETMILLGQQFYSTMIDDNALKSIQDILKAHSITVKVSIDVAADLFVAGFIAGKRAERRKKGGKTDESK